MDSMKQSIKSTNVRRINSLRRCSIGQERSESEIDSARSVSRELKPKFLQSKNSLKALFKNPLMAKRPISVRLQPKLHPDFNSMRQGLYAKMLERKTPNLHSTESKINSSKETESKSKSMYQVSLSPVQQGNSKFRQCRKSIISEEIVSQVSMNGLNSGEMVQKDQESENFKMTNFSKYWKEKEKMKTKLSAAESKDGIDMYFLGSNKQFHDTYFKEPLSSFGTWINTAKKPGMGDLQGVNNKLRQSPLFERQTSKQISRIMNKAPISLLKFQQIEHGGSTSIEKLEQPFSSNK